MFPAIEKRFIEGVQNTDSVAGQGNLPLTCSGPDLSLPAVFDDAVCLMLQPQDLALMTTSQLRDTLLVADRFTHLFPASAAADVRNSGPLKLAGGQLGR